jgi:uncharacterized protein (TIGR01244 family)
VVTARAAQRSRVVKKPVITLSATCLVIVLAVAWTAAQTTNEALPGTSHYTRVSATVACGGATTAEAYPALKKEGFASVINLRLPGEPGADIDGAKAAAAAAGLKYIHIPMDGRNLKPEVLDTFLAAVKEPSNAPVYIHCATANRVGAVWLVKRVLVDGWNVDKATTEAEKIGLKSPHLKQFALDYINSRRG